MNVLMLTIGSAGDMLPFVGLGAELQRRGHTVTLAGNGYFQDAVDRAGLAFTELVSAEEYRREVLDRRDWSIRGALQFAVRRCTEKLEPARRLVLDALDDDPQTVVIAQLWILGARVAREQANFPLFTVHMQPMWLVPSRRATPALHWSDRLRVHIYNTLTDGFLGKPVNEFRRRHGLAPVRQMFQDWWHGPEGVLGFFPDWFGSMPPHQIANFTYLGFPRYDEAGDFPDKAALESFLQAGEPPILFSAPSFLKPGTNFRSIGLQAAARLNARAIFLGSVADPAAPVEPHVRDYAYIPLAQVVPHCRAHVHHGGMGTLSAALAAGIPQVAIPAVSDQPDNAKRLAEIGVARMIPSKRLTVARLSAALDDVLTSAAVRSACADYQRRILAEDAFTTGADQIEQAMSRDRSNGLVAAG